MHIQSEPIICDVISNRHYSYRVVCRCGSVYKSLAHKKCSKNKFIYLVTDRSVVCLSGRTLGSTLLCEFTQNWVRFSEQIGSDFSSHFSTDKIKYIILIWPNHLYILSIKFKLKIFNHCWNMKLSIKTFSWNFHKTLLKIEKFRKIFRKILINIVGIVLPWITFQRIFSSFGHWMSIFNTSKIYHRCKPNIFLYVIK